MAASRASWNCRVRSATIASPNALAICAASFGESAVAVIATMLL